MKDEGALKLSDKASDRILVSYGSWMGIVAYLQALEVLQLQLLCPYMSRTGLPRLQSSWSLKSKAYFKIIDGVSVFFVDERGNKITTTDKNTEYDWRNMQMVPFMHGMIGVDYHLKVN